MGKQRSEFLKSFSECKYFIVQVKVGDEWRNKNVFKDYLDSKVYASYLENSDIRIDCFSPSCGIHTYVLFK